MSQVVDDLKATRELISDPAHWTTKVSARNAQGVHVLPLDPTATCFCVLGAIFRVATQVEDLLIANGMQYET